MTIREPLMNTTRLRQTSGRLVISVMWSLVLILIVTSTSASQDSSAKWLSTALVRAFNGTVHQIHEVVATDSCYFIRHYTEIIVARRTQNGVRLVDTFGFPQRIDEMTSVSDTSMVAITENKLVRIGLTQTVVLDLLPDGVRGSDVALASSPDYLVMCIADGPNNFSSVRLYAIEPDGTFRFLHSVGVSNFIHEIAMNGKDILVAASIFDSDRLVPLTIRDDRLSVGIDMMLRGVAHSLSISGTHISFNLVYSSVERETIRMVYRRTPEGWETDPISFGGVTVRTVVCQEDALYVLCSDLRAATDPNIMTIRVYRKSITDTAWILSKSVYTGDVQQMIVGDSKVVVVDEAGYREYDRIGEDSLYAHSYQSIYQQIICVAALDDRIIFATRFQIFSARILPNSGIAIVDSMDASVTSLHFQQPHLLVASGKSTLLLDVAESGAIDVLDSVPLTDWQSVTRSIVFDSTHYVVVSVFEGARVVRITGDSLSITRTFTLPIADAVRLPSGSIALVSMRDSLCRLSSATDSVVKMERIYIKDTNARILNADVYNDTLLLLIDGGVYGFMQNDSSGVWLRVSASNLSEPIQNFEVIEGVMWFRQRNNVGISIWEIHNGMVTGFLRSLDGRYFDGPALAGDRLWIAGGTRGLFEIQRRVASVEVPGDLRAGFQIYPNPAHDVILISCPSRDARYVSIVSINGDVLACTELSRGGSENFLVDVSMLNPGCYVVSILDERYTPLLSRNLLVLDR